MIRPEDPLTGWLASQHGGRNYCGRCQKTATQVTPFPAQGKKLGDRVIGPKQWQWRHALLYSILLSGIYIWYISCVASGRALSQESATPCH